MEVHCQAPGKGRVVGKVVALIMFLLNTFLEGKQFTLGPLSLPLQCLGV